MPLLSRLDTLAAVLAAVTGLAMAEDRSRTEISPAVTAEAVSPATLDPATLDPATLDPATLDPATLDPEPMTPEVCAELAEYRRRALRATMILAGGLPDSDWPGQPKDPSGECAAPQAPVDPARHNPAPE